MEIKPNTQTRPSPAASQPAVARALQPGDRVHVTALTKVDHGIAIVRLGSTILTAYSDTALRPGQKLLLEVVEVANTPVLRPVSAASDPASSVDQAFRSALPRQDSFAPLLANLIQVAHHKGTLPVPDSLVDAAQTFLAKLPSVREISSADGLLTAFKNSGLFLEIRLRQQANPGSDLNLSGTALTSAIFERDLKVGLLKLYESILQSKTTANSNTQMQSDAYEKVVAKADSVQNLLNRITIHIQQLHSKLHFNHTVNTIDPVTKLKVASPIPASESIAATLLAGYVGTTLRKFPMAGIQLLTDQLTLAVFTEAVPRAKSILSHTVPPVSRNLNDALLTQILANVNTARKEFAQLLTADHANQVGTQTYSQTIQAFARRLYDLGQLLAESVKHTGLSSETTVLAKALQRTALSLVGAQATNAGPSALGGSTTTNYIFEERTSDPRQSSPLRPTAMIHHGEWLLPPSKTTFPQAQPRTSTTIFPQDPFARIITALLNNVESSLARQQLHQLASRAGDSDQQTWSFELPIRREQGVDVAQLRITREGGHDKQAQTQTDENLWCVQLALDLPELGPIQAKIGVAESTVSATIWASNPATVQLFQSHVHALEENLHRAGLHVNQVSVVKGQIPNADAFTETDSLLDEHA